MGSNITSHNEPNVTRCIDVNFRPMDLLKMEEKLDNEEYLRYSDFRNDFKLIVNNCRLYNGNNNGLRHALKLTITKWLIPVPF